MKNTLKKSISVLLATTMLLSTNMVTYAGEAISPQASSEMDVRLENNLKTIETALEEQGTTVSQELKIAIGRLEEEKARAGSMEDKNKIQALIDTTKELEISYNNYTSGVVTRGIDHPVLTPAVAAVATYFSSSGYLLSFELLVHAQDNNVLDSNYVPYYGDRILSSPVVMKIKQGGKDASGSSSFENSGTQVQKDLYYAIHAFNYTFVRNTGKFNLTDRYDFAYGDYEGIAGAAINTMWQAQVIGVLVPYYVKITV